MTKHGSRALGWLAFFLFALFLALAFQAHSTPYFPIDLTTTVTVQTLASPGAGRLMLAISWLGFAPQAAALPALAILVLIGRGRRREALGVTLACFGAAAGQLVKVVVDRPRPDPGMVHVVRSLPESGFPSGHVVEVTCFCGFLAYLAWRRTARGSARAGILVLFCLVTGAMGLSRIYEGAHWLSDVAGGFLLGILWVMLCAAWYRRPSRAAALATWPASPKSPRPSQSAR